MQGGNGENDRAGVGGDPRGRSLLLLHPPPAALNSLPTLSRPVERRTASVGGGDCPPSCQPIPAHCRGRQSGHFLETGSLLPPPAALRRFPRRPADMHRTPCPASVGRGAHTPPLAAHRTTKPCHCEERSDVAIRTPFAPHLQPMRRGGVLPRPICRTLPVISCRAAPMCAAADTHRTPDGGAHGCRPTGKNKNRAEGTIPTSPRRRCPPHFST